MSSTSLPRILAVTSNPASRISAYVGLLQLMRQDAIAAPQFGQTLGQVLHLIHYKRCPFEYVLLDLNFPESFMDLSQAMTDMRQPHDQQTGHFMALKMLEANPDVRCIICTDNPRDDADSDRIERAVFGRYAGRFRHISAKRARLHGRVSTEMNSIEWCPPEHLTPQDPVVIDWLKAGLLAFPDAADIFSTETALTV